MTTSKYNSYNAIAETVCSTVWKLFHIPKIIKIV